MVNNDIIKKCKYTQNNEYNKEKRKNNKKQKINQKRKRRDNIIKNKK